MTTYKLTEYSHGAGCGCKISPQVLDQILHTTIEHKHDPRLLVGNHSRDDAAVYDMGDGRGVISTTDFFMPIVDDPFDFGRIAATNAISDIYAMGGKPLMAIAILGWPVDKLPPSVAARVIEGGREACAEAGIMLAGGHSIDSQEPIFGLAVTGEVSLDKLKQNNTAKAGAKLYLTKPLGIGILTTAQKQKKLQPQHDGIATALMCQMNKIGVDLADVAGVCALTDVTGFGLLGHLLEVCEGSNLMAKIDMSKVPLVAEAEAYRQQGCVPGGTERNFMSYGDKAQPLTEQQKQYLCDPQTSGGLLVAVEPHATEQVEAILANGGFSTTALGELCQYESEFRVVVG
ncbi:MAG: selenide,water dikinase [Phenylobacterium sp.]|jgi:selenide,water dikinase